MSWVEVWDEFKFSSPEELKYGEFIAKRLCELDEKYDGQSAPQRARQAYDLLLEHFDGDVPTWIQEDFVKGLNFNKDYILENLQSHNWKGLATDLKKRFGEDLEVSAHTEDSTLPVVFVFPDPDLWEEFFPEDTDSQEDSEAFKDLKKIAEFYGYFVSQVKKSTFWRRIWLEPRYPEDAYSYVHDKCGGWGYTIVPRINAAGVDAAGLRCKSGNNRELEKAKSSLHAVGRHGEAEKLKMYRNFPERIYFSAFEDSRPEEEIQDICDEIGRRWNDVVVYRINFNKLHCPIYRDPAMNSKHAFFTYHNIPKELLEKVWNGPTGESSF